MKRLFAWVALSATVVGVYQLAGAWRNPWATVTSAATVVPNPVLANLPKAAPGCGEKCSD